MKVSDALTVAALDIQLDLEANGASYTEQEQRAKEKAAALIRDLAATWRERREIHA